MSLTSRRERQPSGRSNLGSARLPQISPQRNASTSDSFSASSASLDTSILPASMVQKRKQMQAEKMRINDERSKALGEYNEYSVPRPSKNSPLRTVFLDPEVNNFPRSRTRSELIERIRKNGLPDSSYDIDGDGFVSQEDYKFSKTYDLDRNGILESEETQIGLEMSANLRNMMLAKKRKEILECLALPPAGLALTQHNYYTNKFDPSAWNDFDAIPRSASDFGIDNHGGSRKRLLFSRTLHDRKVCQDLLDKAYEKTKVYDNRRTNQITDVAYENS